MTFWALVFVAVIVGAHATTFNDCASQICALKKSEGIKDSDKAMMCLKLFDYDFDKCEIPSPTEDEQSMPKCDGPTTPNDVTMTCAKKDNNSQWLPNPKCYSADIGFDTNTGCVSLFEKLYDFIIQSDKDCEAGDGRRRRRSAAVPGLGFSF